jgi:hypothetical protein
MPWEKCEGQSKFCKGKEGGQSQELTQKKGSTQKPAKVTSNSKGSRPQGSSQSKGQSHGERTSQENKEIC